MQPVPAGCWGILRLPWEAAHSCLGTAWRSLDGPGAGETPTICISQRALHQAVKDKAIKNSVMAELVAPAELDGRRWGQQGSPGRGAGGLDIANPVTSWL